MIAINGTPISEPRLLPRLNVELDLRKLFTTLLSSVPVAMTAASPAESLAAMVSALVSGADALTIETPIENRAWRLIYRSYGIALAELVTELPPGDVNGTHLKDLLSRLSKSLKEIPLNLDDQFFVSPKTNPALPAVQEALKETAILKGLSASEANIFSARLPSYFAASLHSEWLRQPKDYQQLLDAVDSPFRNINREERASLSYRSWLSKQIDLPVFEESFSLKDVFVPLRGYSESKNEKCDDQLINSSDNEAIHLDHADSVQGSKNQNKSIKTVVDINQSLSTWLINSVSDDSIRIISGGPGSGKSTLLKILAASASENLSLFPIYIPLQRISFQNDLRSSVTSYLNDSGLYSGDIFEESKNSSIRIVLILDGLDELAKPGAVADTLAQEFLIELQRTLSVSNTQKYTCCAIVSGRTVAIQKTNNVIRLKSHQQISVMRYAYKQNERNIYDDPKKLLNEDQRKTWWKKYSKAKGLSERIPSRLLEGDLFELSSEPLLNYLLVLSGFHVKPKTGAEINRNDVYKSLLGGVHSRGYESGRYQPTQSLSDDEFAQIMETVAVAAWYGDGRTASVDDIRSRCSNKNLQEIFDRFITAGPGGVTRLVAAFYFQAANGNDHARSDEAFEFTHKSFGEYLTARRIVRAVDRLSKELLSDQSERETPFDEMSALQSWVSLCGSAPIDTDLYRFVSDEVAMPHWDDRRSSWAQSLAKMINAALIKGIPPEEGAIRNSLAVAKRARNAEESLWCVAGACSSFIQAPLNIVWPNKTSAGDLIHRLRGQRWPDRNSVLLNSFAHVNFRDQTLVVQDLYSGIYKSSDFSGAKLIKSEMQGSDFSYAKFVKAALAGCDFGTSELVEADFSDVHAHKIDLGACSLDRAKFRGAHLSNADLSDCSLHRAHFEECYLDRSTIAGSQAVNTNWSNAQLSQVDASEANFEGAMFEKAEFKDVNFSGANLVGANFKGAKFTDCNFVGAHFDDQTFIGSKGKINLSKNGPQESYDVSKISPRLVTIKGRRNKVTLSSSRQS